MDYLAPWPAPSLTGPKAFWRARGELLVLARPSICYMRILNLSTYAPRPEKAHDGECADGQKRPSVVSRDAFVDVGGGCVVMGGGFPVLVLTIPPSLSLRSLDSKRSLCALI